MCWAADDSRYLRPGCAEPLGAGSLEAGRARLRFVGLVTAAVWKLFEHSSFQASTHHLTLSHAAATGSVTLKHRRKTKACTILT